MNHNCAAHGCKTTLTRRVIQERQQTDRFENEVNHAVEPNDCFLNLAQLRSALDVQKFRSGVRFTRLSLVEVIEQSIHNRERLEREAKETEAVKEAERLEKAAGKQANVAKPKPKGKPPQKPKAKAQPKTTDAAAKKKNGGGGGKRKRVEVDPDFAEGGEELEYQPRPSKSRGVQQVQQ